MTAPDRTTWTLEPDGDGESTLWHDGWAVLRPSDMATPRRYQDALWQVLTAVLAPDEATIDRLALAHCPDPAWHLQGCPVWAQRGLSDRDPCNCHRSRTVRAVLAALAGSGESE